MKRPVPGTASPHAFSLVEVAVAVGLVTFAMVALFGLLPTGLQSIRESKGQANASLGIERLALSLRQAEEDGAGRMVAAAPFGGEIEWEASPVNIGFLLDESGRPTDNAAVARLTVRVDLYPPSTPFGKTRAMIRMAWPAAAEWEADREVWTKADGSVESWVAWLAP